MRWRVWADRSCLGCLRERNRSVGAIEGLPGKASSQQVCGAAELRYPTTIKELPVRTAEPTFRRTTAIPAPIEEVWDRVTTPAGINHEMSPFIKMTLPGTFRHNTIGDVSPGTHIGKSILLLFGLIPFGYDDITIAQIEPGRMFVEESTMTGMRTWIHQRTLEQRDGKTLVTDAITLEPYLRVPVLTRIVGSVIAAFFAHRHRRLDRYFGPARR